MLVAKSAEQMRLFVCYVRPYHMKCHKICHDSDSWSDGAFYEANKCCLRIGFYRFIYVLFIPIFHSRCDGLLRTIGRMCSVILNDKLHVSCVELR